MTETMIPAPRTADELFTIIRDWLTQDGDWSDWEREMADLIERVSPSGDPA